MFGPNEIFKEVIGGRFGGAVIDLALASVEIFKTGGCTLTPPLGPRGNEYV